MHQCLSYVITWLIVFNQIMTLEKVYINEIYNQIVIKVG